MGLPDWLVFGERPFPSGNIALLRGPRPWLVDTGFGSEVQGTEEWLVAAGVEPGSLAGIVNTHYHSDHVGGNYRLQTRYGLPVAASAFDAQLINSRDPSACAAAWLDQPVEPYRVDRALEDGDEIDTGLVRVRVITAPGHTHGQICLYSPSDRVLVAGDALHCDDVPWINRYVEGEDALEQMLVTLDRLQMLDSRLAVSGHGPAIEDVAGALQATKTRYERWRNDPERMAWHACKRIFSYALMISNGLSEEQVRPYLLGREWFQDYSSNDFGTSPAEFVTPFLAEMLRSGAADWRDGRLVARTLCNPIPGDWLPVSPRPAGWPPAYLARPG